MRRLALVVVLGLAGCGAEGDTGEGGACAAALVRDGMFYLGTGVDAGRGVRSGELIEHGFEIPGCNDGGGFEPNRPTTVFAIRGVSPELAVIDDVSLYVNTGYFTELRDHPLHDVLHGSRDEPRRDTLGSPCTVEGRVLDTTWDTRVETARRDVDVVVRAGTEIEGLDRAGHPYVQEGDALLIHGRCRKDRVVARRIEPGA
jgi:hypothetical protein